MLDPRTPLQFFLRVGTHRSGGRNGGGGCRIRGYTQGRRRSEGIIIFVTVAAAFRDINALARDVVAFLANDFIDCVFDALRAGRSKRPYTTDCAASTAAGAADAIALFQALVRPNGGWRGWLLLFLAFLGLVDANAGELVGGRFQYPAAGQYTFPRSFVLVQCIRRRGAGRRMRGVRFCVRVCVSASPMLYPRCDMDKLR